LHVDLIKTMWEQVWDANSRKFYFYENALGITQWWDQSEQ